ncbi:MAG: aminopeptidase N [Rhodobiaceae bacterium]|nr:MAG: aminopeptidase N [Rhodobiaceae bacterium]
MKTEEPRPVLLSEYRPPAFLVDKISLEVSLDPDKTEVRSFLHMRRNPDAPREGPLVLDGEHFELKEVRLDDERLGENRYQVDDTSLTIATVPDEFVLSTLTTCAPAANTALTGLYQSNGIFCTQCEAEGFRRITYYLDRPDVMAEFRTRIVADKSLASVLLSNGNCVAEGTLEDGRHFAEWHDPFKKPAYLFALVAGDLAVVEDSFHTMSGRDIALRIFVEPGNEDRCAYAMDALKRSMKWDEEVFGREYDLDIFMIVAVSAFNMGAMENKGLNVFNDKYVLARPDTATDADYAAIESIVAHEYFHNWTGNRITCRDWFQLCLKEGLTVFRDQEFTSDQRSRAVKRIADVRLLRTHQFPEDGGPLSHPVRPNAYIEINNFYTATVYEKGAELVRMIHTLLGAERFRKGMDLYFERHDGEAATVEDFLSAIGDGGDEDLSGFKNWYSQAGTPEVLVTTQWDQASATYTAKMSQICPPTPGQPNKTTLPIPIELGLLCADGTEIPLQLDGEDSPGATSRIVMLDQREQVFRFHNVTQKPVPSLLRGFTAPVKLSANQSERDWTFLMAHDSDPFNRWEAGQKYASTILISNAEALQKGGKARQGNVFSDIIEKLLADENLEPEFVAQMITLPAEQTLAQTVGSNVDVEAIHAVRNDLRSAIAERLWETFRAAYDRLLVPGPYSPDAESAGRRTLRNTCLSYLVASSRPEGLRLAVEQFQAADNMTDEIAALALLADHDGPERETALEAFHERWKTDNIVIDKWFAIQAVSTLPGTLENVKRLTEHPVFSLSNPNKVRALIGSFANANQLRFHAADGSGYSYIGDNVLELDRLNPQVAARLLGAFKSWRQFDSARQDQMKAVLEKIVNAPGISQDVYEIASKSLS